MSLVFGYLRPHPLQPAAAAVGCERQKSERNMFSHFMHIHPTVTEYLPTVLSKLEPLRERQSA